MFKVSTIVVVLFTVFFLAEIETRSQTTEFTYQGSFKDGANPANGSYDFEFKLFDLASGGVQQGSTLQRLNVPVVSGIFTVSLDFGAGTLSGADRFLDIALRTSGGGAFTQLSPRQKVNSAPYSVRSLNSTTADVSTNATQLGGIAADQYVVSTDPRMTDARPPTAGSTNYVQNGTSMQAATNFNIGGSGTISGTLQANIVRAGLQFNLGSDRVLRASPCIDNLHIGIGAGALNGGCAFNGNRNTFVGANSGNANTGSPSNQNNSFFGAGSGLLNGFGFQNSFFGTDSGNANTSGDGNSFFGYLTGITNTGGNRNTVIGSLADLGANNLSNATAIGANSRVDQSDSLILGSVVGINGATSGIRVGIGTTTPEREFHLRGPSNVEMQIESSDVGGRKWTLQSSAGASNGRFEIVDRTLGVNRFAIKDNGNVGIGTTDPDDKLHVSGIIRVTSLGAAGSEGLCRNASNQISTCSSSLRYKTNIYRFTDGLSFVNKLRPISFDWRTDGIKDVGFGAEDIAAIDPRFVSYNSNGEVEGVKYDRLSVAFVNAFKEQQMMIERQQKQIDEQREQIEALMRLACSHTKEPTVCPISK